MLDRRSALALLGGFWLAPAAWAQGPGADFEALLATVEDAAEPLPGASHQIEAKEVLRSFFGAAQPVRGKSSRRMTDRTLKMITALEVTNKRRYEDRYRRPIWPGAHSGVTIGIGYDLGYVNNLAFEEDWRDYLPEPTRGLLRGVLGLKRTAARTALGRVQAVDVPYDTAYPQFVAHTLPKYVAETEFALENTALLPGDSMGALVSLTFNRGASYVIAPERDRRGRFREMREIRRLMRERAFSAIPQQIRSMKRIWAGDPNVAGLVTRREMEARLFELGLAER